MLMKIMNNKQQYSSPEAEVFEVKTEGVVCDSISALDYEDGGELH